MSECRYCKTDYLGNVCPGCGYPPSKIKGEPTYRSYYRREYVDAVPCKHCGQVAPVLRRKERMGWLPAMCFALVTFGLGLLIVFIETDAYFCAACGRKT